LEELDTLQLNLTDAETGQRGFIITGDASYLDPYTDALGHVQQSEKSLRELTSDNPVQQTSVDRLEPMVASKLTELHELIVKQA
jgi:CHASE3 domain sensor protein